MSQNCNPNNQTVSGTTDGQPLISIIVPVYNMEDCLSRCIDSIICQTHENLEIILINDGSADKSGEICDNYAKHDRRIRVIHQQNAGVSSARNAGLDIAQGEWVGFVDSDDWIDPNMYEKLLITAVEHGKLLACCNFISYHSTENQALGIRDEIPIVLSREQSISYCLDLEYRYFCGYIWSFIFHYSVFNRTDNPPIRFDKSIHYHEDRLLLIHVLINTDGIAYVNEAMYYYYQRRGSAVNVVDKKRMTLIIALKQVVYLVEPVSPELHILAQQYFVKRTSHLLSFLCHNRHYKYVSMIRREVGQFALRALYHSGLTVKMKMKILITLLLPGYFIGIISRLRSRNINVSFDIDEI